MAWKTSLELSMDMWRYWIFGIFFTVLSYVSDASLYFGPFLTKLSHIAVEGSKVTTWDITTLLVSDAFFGPAALAVAGSSGISFSQCVNVYLLPFQYICIILDEPYCVVFAARRSLLKAFYRLRSLSDCAGEHTVISLNRPAAVPFGVDRGAENNYLRLRLIVECTNFRYGPKIWKTSIAFLSWAR